MSKQILFGILNWGLGHATRSEYLIQNLLNEGHTVDIASDGAALAYLKNRFPECRFYELPSYQVVYKAKFLLFNLLLRLPVMGIAIWKEAIWVKKHLKTHHYHQIYSDNRLAFWHSKIESYYISHQLRLPLNFLGALASFVHERFYKRFTHILIPDFSDLQLSGKMGKVSKNLISKVSYLGLISRFSKNSTHSLDGNYVLVLLSGPEPMRSLWEKELWSAAKNMPDWQFIWVRGTNTQNSLPSASNISVLEMVGSTELEVLIAGAKLVLSRCGYTSVMDLIKMRKRVLWVPTPGQPEQEYIGNRMRWQYQAKVICQKNLKLEKDLQQALDSKPIWLNWPV